MSLLNMYERLEAARSTYECDKALFLSRGVVGSIDTDPLVKKIEDSGLALYYMEKEFKAQLRIHDGGDKYEASVKIYTGSLCLYINTSCEVCQKGYMLVKPIEELLLLHRYHGNAFWISNAFTEIIVGNMKDSCEHLNQTSLSSKIEAFLKERVFNE